MKKLSAQNVFIDTLFYADDYTPALNHEYQFTYDEAGKLAFKRSMEFLKSVLR